MKTTRRMGQPGSDVWNTIVDAVEKILCEEGSGALTSRRVAECAGVKQRLVYYYFRTMDDLVVATFRRGAGRELERLEKAIFSKHPLRDIWDIHVHTGDIRLISELMALSNRIDALRKEVKNHIERSRKLQVAALRKAMGDRQADDGISPLAAHIFATSAALALHREAQLGIRMGHAEVKAVIEAFLATLDPAERKASRSSARKRTSVKRRTAA